MDKQTLLMLRKRINTDDNDVIIVLHVKQRDVIRVTNALELAGITKQETAYVEEKK